MHTARKLRHHVYPLLVGLIFSSPTLAGVDLPGGSTLERVDFDRHVMGVLSKAGCNTGSCHGSFQGKNGFRLSLFGYEPTTDFDQLTRDNLGRRIDRVNPDQSLVLLKASGRVPHEGGKRIDMDSWEYAVVREWIRQGTNRDPRAGEIEELRVEPKGNVFCEPGKPLQLRVMARFADGSEENITPLCDFQVDDDAVADVSVTGEVTASQPGDTGLVVLYRGEVAAVRVLVPSPTPPGFQYPDLPTVNFVDELILAKLRKLNVIPSDLADDAEFLRRLYLDVIGTLPEPDEVRQFLADRSKDKRTRKIDELLAHPMHAALWATKFSDITGNNTDVLENPTQFRQARSQQWHDWFRDRIERNVPYDQIVKGVLTATSREEMSIDQWIKQCDRLDQSLEKDPFGGAYAERETLDLFWRRRARNTPIEEWGEKVAAAFLGVRLECAQCHKHPTDRWTQADYRGFANIFGQVTQGSTPEASKKIKAENDRRVKESKNKRANQLAQIQEVYVAERPRTTFSDPDTGEKLPPKALGGPAWEISKDHDVRRDLFHWMTESENPFFARSFVNRVWGHYFGRGLVDPIDDFSLANPPSNTELLDALAESFVTSGYDIRKLERLILTSRTYQLSATPNETNLHDEVNYSRAYVRPLMAEVVVDALNVALGTEENFGNRVPKDKRMIEVGASRLTGNVAYVLDIFGRPPRTAACDCERAMDPALPQTLYRMTDRNLLSKIRARGGRLDTLLKSEKSDEQVFEEMFLATMSRFPTKEEFEAFAEHKTKEPDRQELFDDVVWALINTREFILNH